MAGRICIVNRGQILTNQNQRDNCFLGGVFTMWPGHVILKQCLSMIGCVKNGCILQNLWIYQQSLKKRIDIIGNTIIVRIYNQNRVGEITFGENGPNGSFWWITTFI